MRKVVRLRARRPPARRSGFVFDMLLGVVLFVAIFVGTCSLLLVLR